MIRKKLNAEELACAIIHAMKILVSIILFLLFNFSVWGAEPQTVVGVVNWDCSLPSSTWFGHYATTSLSSAKFRHATPFYADVKGPDQIDYHWRTVEEYEREMQYAIDAGIDYFAYCWYGELKPEDGKDFTPVTKGRENVCDRHVWELATARQLHARSRLRDKLKMCAILVTLHPLADAEIESLARAMKEPWYQTAQGRPLLYLFGGKGKGLLPRIRKACRTVGAGDPYAVVFSHSRYETTGDDGVQAIGAYVDGVAGVQTFAQAAKSRIDGNAKRAAVGMDMIPTFTLGWNPQPRIDHPVPWCGYGKTTYMKPATETEWLQGAREMADWIRANRAACPTGHILSFAWNEFEEGGWICPTWRPDDQPDTSRVDAFRKVGEFWRNALDEPSVKRRDAASPLLSTPNGEVASCRFTSEIGTAVPYIESTGTEWIDTGVTHSPSTRVACEVTLLDPVASYETPFGSRGLTGNGLYFFTRYGSVNRPGLGYGAMTDETLGRAGALPRNRPVAIDVQNGIARWRVEGALLGCVDVRPKGAVAGIAPMFVFSMNEAAKSGGVTANSACNARMRLHAFRMEDGGKTLCDLVPVVKVGEAMLYDRVSGRHLRNGSGAGGFRAPGVKWRDAAVPRRSPNGEAASCRFPPVPPVKGERSVTMFLAFTGRPATADIERKLDALAAGGVNSFMLYPTSGLGYDYLGKEFFEAARTFAAGAKMRGMKMWLYDEHNWPSGSCLGRVPAADESFREWQLALVAEGTNTAWRKVLSPITTSSMCTGGFRKGWPNLLEPRAVDLFTKLTHDAYARELAPWFADDTIRGIFTDEPFHHVLAKWLPKGTVHAVRWYDGLLENYAALTGGGDFKRDAEAWFAAGRQLDLAEVWTRYNELYARRFRMSFFERIRAKTDELGIFATGHMFREDDSVSSVDLNGDPLASLAALSFPGMDEVCTRTDPNTIEWLTLHTVQYAIRRNGQGGMAELFALGPANTTPAKFLKMIRICALHGVTRYFTVMSAMDASWMDEMHGFTVGVGDQQPWFAEFPTFLAAADEASASAAKRAVFDVALRFPRRQCVLAGVGAAPRPDVKGFLRTFECAQTGVELIREEDATAAQLVFAFDGRALREERTGVRFETARAALAWAQARLPERFMLRDVAGRPVPDVLVRTYEDGSHAYVRLGTVPRHTVEGDPVPIDGDWTLSLSAAPTRRLSFDTNGVCRLSLKKPLKGVRLATRGSEVLVDGTGVAMATACDALRPSFNELYRTSAAFDLTTGDHEFRLPGALRDPNWFLPAAFLVEAPVTPRQVSAGSLTSYGLADFCGSATWTKTVEVPKGGSVRLALETGGHFAHVYLGNRDLGAIGWDDFVWKIPADLQGRTCELRIVVHTSLVPLLGAANPSGTKYWGATKPCDCGLLMTPKWHVAQ